LIGRKAKVIHRQRISHLSPIKGGS
jgi:hypothetical protein